MLKKTIEYVDFNEVKREETFYFNLTKSELAELELTTSGGLTEMLEKMKSEQDNAKILEFFKKIIFKAYGEKTSDGKRFVKSEELSIAFSQTGAYDVLFIGFFEHPETAAAFIEGIIPQELLLQIPKLPSQN